MLPQLLSCAYSYKYLEVLWLPKRTQLWACFNTEPNRLYRRLRLFPSKLQEYTPPPFSRLSTQYHIDPLLILVCFLSILHERVCDYSRVQSSITGILRVGYMNIHITWLTHVRTGVMVNPVSPNYCIPELLYPHTEFPSECCTPIHDSLVDPVRGYNIRVVD